MICVVVGSRKHVDKIVMDPGFGLVRNPDTIL